jgi:CO/xanthine dehydrogenase Mo-binding subunit
MNYFPALAVAPERWANWVITRYEMFVAGRMIRSNLQTQTMLVAQIGKASISQGKVGKTRLNKCSKTYGCSITNKDICSFKNHAKWVY